MTGLSAKKIAYTFLKTTPGGVDDTVKDSPIEDIFSIGTGYLNFVNDKGTLDTDGYPTALETIQYTKLQNTHAGRLPSRMISPIIFLKNTSILKPGVLQNS